MKMPVSHIGGEALACGSQLGPRSKDSTRSRTLGDRGVEAPRQELGPRRFGRGRKDKQTARRSGRCWEVKKAQASPKPACPKEEGVVSRTSATGRSRGFGYL